MKFQAKLTTANLTDVACYVGTKAHGDSFDLTKKVKPLLTCK